MPARMLFQVRSPAPSLSKSQSSQRRCVTSKAVKLVSDRVTLQAGSSASKALEFAPILNGCWQLAGGHGREVFTNIDQTLNTLADAGFTTFDTADIYGQSEAILGQFQRARAAALKPSVEIFTKYVPNIFNSRPTPATVEAAIRKSLSNLQASQLALVQLHWWDYDIPGMVDTAKALADLQSSGLIQAIGVTNLNTEALAEIVDAGVPVVSNQVQFSLLDRRPLNQMLPYCEAKGIKLFTYGSVAGGLLSDKYVEEARTGIFGGKRYNNVDLNTSSLKMYMGTINQFGGTELWRQLLSVMQQVASKHSVSVANVALRWVMQQGNGASVYPIVGIRGTSHIQDNMRALSLRLDAADLEAIQAVLARSTGPKGDCYSFERGG